MGNNNTSDAKFVQSPWRKPPSWNEASLKNLKEKVQTHRPPSDLGISQSRILMIGPSGGGKSSFFNTINSIFQERITSQANVGKKLTAMTMKYRQHWVRNTKYEPLNFRLCDTCGLEGNGVPDPMDLNYLLEGNVEDEYEFVPNVPITTESKQFICNPGLDQKIHCVAFVFGANAIELTPEKTWKTISVLKDRMNRLGIPSVVLLTKIDERSRVVADDTTKVFVSGEIQEVVETVSKKLGIQRSDVMPIKNYENENDLECNISILALQAMDRLLGYAMDYLIRKKDLREGGTHASSTP